MPTETPAADEDGAWDILVAEKRLGANWAARREGGRCEEGGAEARAGGSNDDLRFIALGGREE